MYETERKKTVMREGTDNAPKGEVKKQEGRDRTRRRKAPLWDFVTSEETEEYEVQTSELVLEKSSGMSKGRTGKLKK